MESSYDQLSNENSFFEFSRSNYATSSVLPTTIDSDIVFVKLITKQKNHTESIENLDVYLDFLKTDNDLLEEAKDDPKSIVEIKSSLLEEQEIYNKLNEELLKLSKEKEEIECEIMKSLERLNRLETTLS